MYKMYVVRRAGKDHKGTEFLSGSCKDTHHWVPQITRAQHFGHELIAASLAKYYDGTVLTIECVGIKE